jgi:hypothetical protein
MKKSIFPFLAMVILAASTVTCSAAVGGSNPPPTVVHAQAVGGSNPPPTVAVTIGIVLQVLGLFGL